MDEARTPEGPTPATRPADKARRGRFGLANLKRRVVRKRAMRFKCPYCGVMLTGELKVTCPACRRKMRIPQPLLGPRGQSKPKLRYDRHSRSQGGEALLDRLPPFMVKRNTPLLFVFIMVLLFLGFGLISNLNVRQESPENHEESIELAHSELRVLRIALERFREDVGRYPTTVEDLPILKHGSVRVPQMRYRYVRNIRPDPWNEYYVYRNEGEQIVLFSSGPDRTQGTSDDLYPRDGWQADVPRNWPGYTPPLSGEDMVVRVLRRLSDATNMVDHLPSVDQAPELPEAPISTTPKPIDRL